MIRKELKRDNQSKKVVVEYSHGYPSCRRTIQAVLFVIREHYDGCLNYSRDSHDSTARSINVEIEIIFDYHLTDKGPITEDNISKDSRATVAIRGSV